MSAPAAGSRRSSPFAMPGTRRRHGRERAGAQLRGVQRVAERGRGHRAARRNFFEPAAAERFELWCPTPPYVISPETAYLFRDSGLAGDTLSRRLVGDVPPLLREGGFASVHLSWIHQPDEHWSVPLRAWVEGGAGHDALLLGYGSQDTLPHRLQLVARGATPPTWTPSMRRSPAGSTISRVSAQRGIAYGGVVLRRRESGSNWVRVHDLPPAGLRQASHHLLRIFEGVDFVAGLSSDRDLLRAGGFALVEHARGRTARGTALRLNGRSSASNCASRKRGLRFRANVDPLIAAPARRPRRPADAHRGDERRGRGSGARSGPHSRNGRCRSPAKWSSWASFSAENSASNGPEHLRCRLMTELDSPGLDSLT